MNIRKIDLGRLNTATKYPSIATYHTLGERGRLTEEVTGFAETSDATVHLREKLDGANARIVVSGDQWIIGSREELLAANGDLISNPSQGIVEELRPVAERMVARNQHRLAVYYFEVYGGKVGRNAKQYTANGEVGHRLFDILLPEGPRFQVMLRMTPREEIALWRDTDSVHFPARFADQELLAMLAESDELPLVPDLGTIPANELPRTVEGTRQWMTHMLPVTRAHLDRRHGTPEGLIIRTDNPETRARHLIRKLRFEDYDRTLKARTQ